MGFASSMSNDEKNKVKGALSSSSKIFMVAVSRIYYAHPDPQKWSYSGEQGGLAFVQDKSNGSLYFRLIDLQGTRGVIWEHELYDDFTLNDDRPFFHSFPGDVSQVDVSHLLISLMNMNVGLHGRPCLHR